MTTTDTKAVPEHSVAVVGAGIVGVCCALELQRRGAQVTLIDRREPGRETSYGNAGVIARSSLMPHNNPGLRAALPRLLLRGSAALSVNPGYALRQAPWIKAYLSHAHQAPCDDTAVALNDLIVLSQQEHGRLMQEAGAFHRWRDNGWLMLYRDDASFAATQFARDALKRFGVAHEVLNAQGLHDLEPQLAPIFNHALWVKDAASVDSPGAVVDAYAKLFVERGGLMLRAEIKTLRAHARTGAWGLLRADGITVKAKRVVIALGPWSKGFLQQLNIAVPMAFERGYHRHYAQAEGPLLARPVYDAAGGCVLSPMEQGLRMTTGVELDHLDAPKKLKQLASAERMARQALPGLGAALEVEPWLGRRPTLPDSRPMIGELPRLPGLWFAFGHQHIGFSTSAGTAAVLGALMDSQPTPINALPFRPQRFLI